MLVIEIVSHVCLTSGDRCMSLAWQDGQLDLTHRPTPSNAATFSTNIFYGNHFQTHTIKFVTPDQVDVISFKKK